MRYTYDHKKRAANLKKHGYGFDDAHLVIESDKTGSFEDQRFDYGEQRYVTLIWLNSVKHPHAFRLGFFEEYFLTQAGRATRRGRCSATVDHADIRGLVTTITQVRRVA